LARKRATSCTLGETKSSYEDVRALELCNASKPLADYTTELNSDSIVITSNDKPVAALVSFKGMDKEQVTLSTSPEFARIIRGARLEAKKGKPRGLPTPI
jgi:hypothetical protein